MKDALFTVFTIVILAGCATSNNDKMYVDSNNIQAAGLPQATAGTTKTVTGKWNLIPALPTDTATGKIPFLNFDTSAHRVNGNTGCNNFSGAYQSGHGSLIFSKNMMSTKMACMGYDEAGFMKSLLRVNRYEVNGDTLALKADATPLFYWLKNK